MIYRINIDNNWIYTYSYPANQLLTMQLTPKAHFRHFGYLDNLHEYMTSYGYTVSLESVQKLSKFIEDDFINGYSYFCKICPNPEQADDVINWFVGPLAELKYQEKIVGYNFIFPPKDVSNLIENVNSKKITPTMGKEILKRMFQGEKIEELLTLDKFKVSSSNDMIDLIKKVLNENPDQVQKARNNPKMISWFVGQLMKQSGGKIDPKFVKEYIEQEIK